MYFLDMMGLGAFFNGVTAVIVTIFIILLCLTIFAIHKAMEAGEESGCMLKVLLVLDLLFFIIVSYIKS